MGTGRRVAWTLLFYGLGAWAVMTFGGLLTSVLALPPLFGSLLRGALILGVPVAVIVAWRFPEVGTHGQGPASADDRRGHGP